MTRPKAGKRESGKAGCLAHVFLIAFSLSGFLAFGPSEARADSWTFYRLSLGATNNDRTGDPLRTSLQKIDSNFVMIATLTPTNGVLGGTNVTGTNATIFGVFYRTVGQTNMEFTTLKQGTNVVMYRDGTNIVINSAATLGNPNQFIGSTIKSGALLTNTAVETKLSFTSSGTPSFYQGYIGGTRYGLTNLLTGIMPWWIEDPTEDEEVHFGGNIIASGSFIGTNIQLKALPGSGSILALDAAGNGFLTNVTGSGGGGIAATNPNQFAASTVLAIKSGAAQTNTLLYPSLTTATPLTITAKSAQTGNLLDVKDSSGNVMFGVNSTGYLTGDANSEVHFDPAVGALMLGHADVVPGFTWSGRSSLTLGGSLGEDGFDTVQIAGGEGAIAALFDPEETASIYSAKGLILQPNSATTWLLRARNSGGAPMFEIFPNATPARSVVAMAGTLYASNVTASQVAVFDSNKALTNSPISATLLNNFFAVGVSNFTGLYGVDIGTNNGTLWFTNKLSSSGSATNLNLSGTTTYDGNRVIYAQPGLSNYFFGPSGTTTASGSDNTAGGKFALGSLSTGSKDTAFGVSAANSTTTGSNNTAMGWQSLFSNTNGSWNSAFGKYALFDNLSGDGNTAAGYAASVRNTNGIYNSAFGFQSLHYNTFGSYNTAIGYNSLYNAIPLNSAGLDVQYNVGVGANAGEGLTVGYGNTFLGSFSGASSLNQPGAVTYSTALGYGSVANTNHQIVLGTTNEFVFVPGYASIGTNLASRALTVQATNTGFDTVQFSDTNGTPRHRFGVWSGVATDYGMLTMGNVTPSGFNGALAGNGSTTLLIGLGTIRFYVNSAPRWDISGSAGDFVPANANAASIGSAALPVKNIFAATGLDITRAPGTTAGGLPFHAGTNSSSGISLSTNALVGIGTSNPVVSLDVTGAIACASINATGAVTAASLSVVDFNAANATFTNAFSYTPTVITGVGGANTNFTPLATAAEMVINAFTNVSIRAVMGYDPTLLKPWVITLTNGSGTDRTLEFNAQTNRFRFIGPTGLTNAPSMITNATQVILYGRSVGTNTTVRYEYYAWP